MAATIAVPVIIINGYDVSHYNQNITILDKVWYIKSQPQEIKDTYGTYYQVLSTDVFDGVKLNHTYNVRVKYLGLSGVRVIEDVNYEV